MTFTYGPRTCIKLYSSTLCPYNNRSCKSTYGKMAYYYFMLLSLYVYDYIYILLINNQLIIYLSNVHVIMSIFHGLVCLDL